VRAAIQGDHSGVYRLHHDYDVSTALNNLLITELAGPALETDRRDAERNAALLSGQIFRASGRAQANTRGRLCVGALLPGWRKGGILPSGGSTIIDVLLSKFR
jgi:hypothetical protein